MPSWSLEKRSVLRCWEVKSKTEIKIGAEKNLDSAKTLIKLAVLGLARLGCTVFQYGDMMGDSDNNQISHEITHQFARQRAAL